jgi:histone H3/H4
MSEPPKTKAQPKPEEGGFIAKAPIRRIMRGEGAYLVADDAVDLLVEYLTTYGKEITKKALKIAEEDKRTKLTGDDVYSALK